MRVAASASDSYNNVNRAVAGAWIVENGLQTRDSLHKEEGAETKHKHSYLQITFLRWEQSPHTVRLVKAGIREGITLNWNPVTENNSLEK